MAHIADTQTDMSANYNDTDDRAMRLYLAAETDRLRGEYLAMPAGERLAYAQANPTFTLTDGGTPQAMLLGISALHDVGEPDKAAGVAAGHRADLLAAAAGATLVSQAMPLPERVVTAGAWGAATVPLAAISAATGYLAGGPHFALAAAIPAACVGAIAVIRRLVSPVR